MAILMVYYNHQKGNFMFQLTAKTDRLRPKPIGKVVLFTAHCAINGSDLLFSVMIITEISLSKNSQTMYKQILKGIDNLYDYMINSQHLITYSVLFHDF